MMSVYKLFFFLGGGVMS